MNKLMISGRLTDNVTLRQTNNGLYYALIRMATDTFSKTKKAEFVSLKVWGDHAVNLQKYCAKGDAIECEGHVSNADFTDSQGKMQFRQELVVDRITYKDKAPANRKNQNVQQAQVQPNVQPMVQQVPVQQPGMQQVVQQPVNPGQVYAAQPGAVQQNVQAAMPQVPVQPNGQPAVQQVPVQSPYVAAQTNVDLDSGY